MRSVASRDLRNHTAEVLAQVKEGQPVAITVHGAVVAELRPVVARRPATLRRTDLMALVAAQRPDPELAALLEELASDTTDDL